MVKQLSIIVNVQYIGPQVKYSSFLSNFMKLELCERFSKNPQTSDFIKIRPLRAELFLADLRTARHDETNSRVSQFCERT